MDELSIALVQVPLVWENKVENLRILGTWIESISPPVDIIVLPEMFSTGFSMNSQKLAETMDGASVSWMHTQASNKNCILCGSLIIEENGKYYNRLIWMPPSGNCTIYNKRHLFRMAGENQHYSEGQQKVIVKYQEWDICLQVCYDLRFPVWSRRTAKENYDLLLYVANWPERRSHAWKSLLPARAIENQSYVVGLNRVGLDGNNINYSGDSMALNFLGETLISANPGEATVLQVTLSKPELLHFRKSFPAEQDADQFTLSD